MKKVYPRVCGATGRIGAEGVYGGGLSPRVRGYRIATPDLSP